MHEAASKADPSLRHPRRASASLAIGGLAIMAFALLALAGCGAWDDLPWSKAKKLEKERREKEIEDEREVAKIRRPLEPGETYEFEFELDGRWHPSPVSFLKGHQVDFVPLGETAALGDMMLQYRVGYSKGFVGGRNRFTVDIPGAVAMRGSAGEAGIYGDHKARVAIKRLK